MRRFLIRPSGLLIAATFAVFSGALPARTVFAQAAQAAAPQTPAPAATPASVTANWTDAEIEAFLLKARVVSTRPAGKGVTNSLRATLTDGAATHDAQIQTVEERKDVFQTKDGVELNFRDSWQFNVAAYRLDRLIGLDMVPVSVERRWDAKPGAYTWWIDDVMMDEAGRVKKDLDAPDQVVWYEQINHIRLFDQLIRNVDRNLGNMLITKDWRVWAIDHTRAFRTAKDLRTPSYVRRIDRQVLARLKALDRDVLRGRLRPLLRDGEIDAILARRDAIVKIIDKLGSSAVFDRTR